MPPFFLLAAIIALGAVLYRSVSPSQILVGTWERPGETFQLFSNGTIAANGALVGTHTILDDHTARVELSGIGSWIGPQVVAFEVTTTDLRVTVGTDSLTYKQTSPVPIALSALYWLRWETPFALWIQSPAR